MPSDRYFLRQTFRARRDALTSDERAAKSLAVCQHLVAHVQAHGARCVALFAPIGSEVSLVHAQETLQATGVVCLLPRVVARGRSLEFAGAHGPRRVGSLGMMEPLGAAVPLADIALVVVPGLVFDAAGYRLGYGQGYYDRTLAGYAGRTVGAAFALQKVESLPCETHDVPVQTLIDEVAVKPVRP